MLSSIPMNGITYAEQLRANVKQERGEKIPEFEPPRLMNLERKLQILEGEWFVESSYENDDTAALYAFYQPTQGPFIIVPSMIKEELTSDFTLTSKLQIFYFIFSILINLWWITDYWCVCLSILISAR